MLQKLFSVCKLETCFKTCLSLCKRSPYALISCLSDFTVFRKRKTNTFESKSSTANGTKTIFFDRKIQTQNVIFIYKTFPHSPLYHYKTAIFQSFWTFSEVKKHFSETSKCVIGYKLLGSNRPYMSYPMKFTFYLHRDYGY